MVDALLRLQYSASDPVGATAAMRAVLGAAEVSSAGPLAWQQVSLVDDGITVSSIRSSGERVRLGVNGASELTIVLVEQGSAVLTRNGARLALGADALGLIPIGATADLRWDRARLQVFSVPPAPLARLLGVPRSAVALHAPRMDPCSAALAEYWRRTSRLLTSGVFGDPEVYERDLIRAHAIDALTAVTVEAFELTNRSEDRTDRDVHVVRRAVAEMRAHLAEPISIPEVAAAAGVSVRGLQIVFQRQLGTVPLLHLRQLRLEAARADLQSEAGRGTTVADVARRYGYANSGRFSTHYRDEYGESPAATLQRIRQEVAPAPDAVAPEGIAESRAVHPDHAIGSGPVARAAE